MSKEIGAKYQPGATLFAIAHNDNGGFYAGSSTEAWQDGHLSSYAISLTPAGTSGYYFADSSLPAGTAYEAYAQQGGGPALGDLAYLVSAGSIGSAAAAVLDVASSAHNVAGTIGAAINNAGSAADPLNNTVPGSYASGTAGAALGLITTASVSVASPVATNGDTTIVAGDDYASTDGRALTYTDPGSNYPDNASVVWNAYGPTSPTPVLSVTGSMSPSAGAGKTVTVPLTSTQTTLLQAMGATQLALVFTRTNTHVEERVTGKLTVNRRGV